MIEKFVARWEENKGALEQKFRDKVPGSYLDVVRGVIETINAGDDYGEPNSKVIHVIDDGDYQGTILFIIPESGYQPSTYWVVSVHYGSCSVCDTLQSITDCYDYTGNYDDRKLTDQAIKDLMTLALHIVQRIKEI